MSEAEESAVVACRGCGNDAARNDVDNAGFCPSCRAKVVSRATTLAWIPTLVVAALYVALLAWGGLIYSRFLIVWVALGVALAWVAYKISRRVFFDLVRSRAVAARRS